MGSDLERRQRAVRHLLIWGAVGRWIDLSKPDVMAIPETASLIAEDDWLRMGKEAGGEDVLLKTLGIKEISDDDGESAGDPGNLTEREG